MRLTGFLAMLMVTLGLAVGPRAATSPKKGLGMWSFPGAKAADVGASWYYSWGPWAKGEASVAFVPMIWGHRDDYPAAYQAVKASSAEALLTINEPDHCDQACMSVDQAIEMWPRIVDAAIGKRLGSPVVAGDYAWLERWWSSALALHMRMPDFMAVHTYPDLRNPGKAADDVIGLVTWVHWRYGKPVWLTEFGACGGSDQQAQDFIRNVVPRLEALDFVERYAWFSDHPAGCYRSVFDERGWLTDTGRAYRDAQ